MNHVCTVCSSRYGKLNKVESGMPNASDPEKVME